MSVTHDGRVAKVYSPQFQWGNEKDLSASRLKAGLVAFGCDPKSLNAFANGASGRRLARWKATTVGLANV